MNCIKYRRSLIDIDWRRPDTVDKREGSESEAEWGEKWFGLWRWIMQLKHTINAIKITIKHATFATNGWQHCRLGNADGDVDADADVAVDCTKRQRWAELRWATLHSTELFKQNWQCASAEIMTICKRVLQAAERGKGDEDTEIAHKGEQEGRQRNSWRDRRADKRIDGLKDRRSDSRAVGWSVWQLITGSYGLCRRRLRWETAVAEASLGLSLSTCKKNANKGPKWDGKWQR